MVVGLKDFLNCSSRIPYFRNKKGEGRITSTSPTTLTLTGITYDAGAS